jgi:hypothetical protein
VYWRLLNRYFLQLAEVTLEFIGNELDKFYYRSRGWYKWTNSIDEYPLSSTKRILFRQTQTTVKPEPTTPTSTTVKIVLPQA